MSRKRDLIGGALLQSYCVVMAGALCAVVVSMKLTGLVASSVAAAVKGEA